ncbi:OMP-b-brl-2 domain-containing protein [Candidatus Ornithobacterium hominis]|uniref:porin family protein n=1 Tax=Candidatus Ornithobacterium hominis TaxID=2497989 RepID=UPI0024BCAEE2|nr:porin family protein [Candidatus Ornithobacterium hominis]CAI9428834.1 OMP-b-brl-2 domain-containing protein [Candidatus Ornithobacterium hominis]
MKNLVVLLIAIFGFSTVQAQFFDDVRIGAKLNGNYSKINQIHGNSKSKFGFGGGAVFMKPINNSFEYNVQVELLFNQYGEKNETANFSEKFNLNYLSLPILFKAYFSEQETEVFGLIGPQLGYLIGKSEFKNENYNKFDFGLTGGLGLSLNRNIEGDIRIYYGLLDSSEWKEHIKAEDKVNNNFAVSLGVTYLF